MILTIILTEDKYNGTNMYSVSEDGKFAIHTFSSNTSPAVTQIIRLPSHESANVLAANDRLARHLSALNLPQFEFFRVDIPCRDIPMDSNEGGSKGGGSGSEGGSGTVALDAWCLYPPDFDSAAIATYPVIFHVYGEPAGQLVRDMWMGKNGLWHRMLAQQGAVVICIDNRGVPAPRGRKWRKCIYGKIGQLASEDQVEAVRRVLQTRAYLNPSKVAVWGWSGGGSMTLNALFRYPETYHCGISVAPVPDMNLYDTIYQERYMGLPTVNEAGYRNGSPISFAHQMKESQSLLLIHGTGDDNCHYAGTEKLINVLIEHNKPFQMLAYPNRSHSISEGANTSRHLYSQMTTFFKTNGYIKETVVWL